MVDENGHSQHYYSRQGRVQIPLWSMKTLTPSGVFYLEVFSSDSSMVDENADLYRAGAGGVTGSDSSMVDENAEVKI